MVLAAQLVALGACVGLAAAVPGSGGSVRGRAGPTASPTDYPVTGIDVSNHQRTIDWPSVARGGAAFAIAKATEGVRFVDPYFQRNNAGAKDNGLYAGAYHFGRPDRGGGRAQADFFMDHNRWVDDGRTLPPMLDIEWPWQGSGAPYPCYGLSPGAMVTWIREFVDRIRERTGRPAMIYTNVNWWVPCTGNNDTFGDTYLAIARYQATPGPMPASWRTWTFWQHNNHGILPGDQDVFNGSLADLAALAGRRVPGPSVAGGRMGDLTGDGRPEIAGLDAAGDALYVHRNTSTPGNPDRAPGVLVSIGWAGITALMTADYDSDGRDDILGRQVAGDTLILWRSTSTAGRVSLAPYRILGRGWNSIGTLLPLADFTGDGRPEIAGLDAAGDALYVHRNTNTPGRAGVGPRTLVSVGWAGISTFMTADYDSDGRDDILGRQVAGDTLILWRSTSTAGRVSFAPYRILGRGWNSIGTLLPLADLTGDGRPDIAGLDDTGDALYLHRNTSTPGRAAVGPRTLASIGWSSISTFLVADFDRDGRDNILGRQVAGDTVILWHSTSTPTSYLTFGRGWNALGRLLSHAPA